MVFLGETSPVPEKKKYMSPMQHFILITNKYRVHKTESTGNTTTTDQGSSPESSATGNIALQSLEANSTKTDGVTTTQTEDSSTTSPLTEAPTTASNNASGNSQNSEKLTGGTTS